MPYTVTTAPSAEPLTTAEAKTHMNVTTSADDTYIATLIVAAREYVQNRIRRSLITQTITATFDKFTECIELERGPVQSVTSVSYVDAAGDTQLLATSYYQTDLVTVPPRIVEAYSKTWPLTRDQLNAVTIVFVAGYGAAAAVPQPIKHAMLLYIAHLYENRESVITGTIVSEAPQSVDALLSAYRVW